MTNPLNFDWPSVKVCSVGMSGTGKSTLITKRIMRERARWKFVFDHKNNGEFSRRNCLPVCMSFDEVERATVAGGWVIYNPVAEYPGAKEEAFEMFANFVREVCMELRGRKLLFVDELQAVQAPTRKPLELSAICDEGRTSQLDCFFISSRPNEIHNSIRSQITEVYAFRIVEKCALDWLKDNSLDGEAVRALPNGRYIWRNFDTGETREGGEAFSSDRPANSGRDGGGGGRAIQGDGGEAGPVGADCEATRGEHTEKSE